MVDTGKRESPKTQIENAYRAALHAVHGSRVVQQHLRDKPAADLTHLIAVGKAAPAMAAGACEYSAGKAFQGLVITKYGHAAGWVPPASVRVLESGHPIPDANSLAAGQALLEFVDNAGSSARFLVLISGGASGLVECLRPGLSLQWLVGLNRWLLASGLDIHAINAIRGRCSRIKNGGLGRRIGTRPVLGLLISDVPGDDKNVIGGGLLECGTEPIRSLSRDIPKVFAHHLPNDKPSVATDMGNITQHIAACSDTAVAAAADWAHEAGYAVETRPRELTGDVAVTASNIARRFVEGPNGMTIWGGETTMRLPESPGHGGRNQTMAVLLARHLAGVENVWVLAAGTDGTDGNTQCAGGLVDGNSYKQALDAGIDPDACLKRGDSNRVLRACNASFTTGPTGTNVMDIVIGLKTSPGV